MRPENITAVQYSNLRLKQPEDLEKFSVLKTLPNLTSLEIRGCALWLDLILEPQIKSKNIRTLKLLDINIGSNFQLVIGTLPTITELEYSRISIYPLHLAFLKTFTNLEKLNLHSDICSPNASALPTTLKELALIGRSSMNCNLIKKLTNLRTLKIGFQIDAVAFLNLKDLDLESLDLQLPDHTEISVLANMTSLRELKLRKSSISALDFGGMKCCEILTRLVIQECSTPIWNLELRKIKSLVIKECDLPFLPALPNPENLLSLNFSSNDLTDETIGPVSPFTSLTELHLHRNQLKTVPPGIEHLTNLTILDLSGNPIPYTSGVNLKPISQLSKLKKLNVMGDPFTEAKVLNPEVLLGMTHVESCDIVPVGIWKSFMNAVETADKYKTKYKRLKNTQKEMEIENKD